MKSLSLIGLASAGIVALSSTASATTAGPYDLVTFGTLGFIGFDTPSGSSLENMSISEFGGGLDIETGIAESSPFARDGGITLYGRPVRLVLGGSTLSGTPYHDGAFEIWSEANAGVGTTAFPAMKVDTGTHTAAFKGVDVTIDSDGTNGGTLKVGGKAVLTQGGGATALGLAAATGVNSFAAGGSLTSAAGILSFAAVNGVASSTNSAAIGTSSVADAMNASAFGYGAQAHAVGSVAIGYGANAVSGASNSVAMSGGQTHGTNSTAVSVGSAVGSYSLASGGGVATGNFSFATGPGAQAQSYGATALGLYGLTYTGETTTAAVDTDSLLVVGNGTTSALRSDSLKMLKTARRL